MKRQSPLKDFHLVGDWGPGVGQAGYLNKESVPDSLLEKDLTMKCFSKRSCPGTRSSVVMVQLVLVISHTGSRTWYHPCGKWGEECEALFYSHAECKSDSHGTCGANVEMIEFHTKPQTEWHRMLGGWDSNYTGDLEMPGVWLNSEESHRYSVETTQERLTLLQRQYHRSDESWTLG